MVYRGNGKIKMICPDCKIETKINAELPIGKSIFLDAECPGCKLQFDLELRPKIKKKVKKESKE